MKKFAIGAFLLGASMANAQPEAVPGEYVVKLKANVEKSSFALQNQMGIEVVRNLSKESQSILVRDSMLKKSTAVISALSSSDLVEYVEPNYVYRINRVPNDPDFSKLWGMKNDGQLDPKGRQGIANADIDADLAWDINTGSEEVVVAVIDTGVDPSIPDLAPNMWVNHGEIPGNGIDDDNNGYVDDVHGYDFVNKDGDPTDDHGHGSHCAGTIGAKGDDGVGVAGVVWNTRIMAVKFLSAQGSGSLADAVSSIDYATSMGAKIQSNSWGGGGYSKALEDAIKRADAKNSLFVAAAGNDRANNDSGAHYPSNYQVPNVVSVAAINNSGELATFSNYGRNTVHLAAPGRNIQSTVPGGYAVYSGTSMATPHVSGVAALVLSEVGKMSAKDLKERLMRTAKPFAGVRGKTITGAVVNAYYAVTDQTPPPDANDPSQWPSEGVNVSSEHPYANKADIRFTVSKPGAKKIAIYFSKFDTEANYDKVYIYDKSGNLVTEMSGTNNDSFSPAIAGDEAVIRLVTDQSVNKYGFDITAVHYQE